MEGGRIYKYNFLPFDNLYRRSYFVMHTFLVIFNVNCTFLELQDQRSSFAMWITHSSNYKIMAYGLKTFKYNIPECVPILFFISLLNNLQLSSIKNHQEWYCEVPVLYTNLYFILIWLKTWYGRYTWAILVVMGWYFKHLRGNYKLKDGFL